MPPTRSRLRLALTELRKPGERRLTRLAAALEAVLPPRTASLLFPPAPDRASKIVVATYNVHKCVGTDGKFDPERVADVIAELDADVLAVQEADRRIGLRNGLLDLARLERHTGLQLVPVAVRPVSHGWHGNALFVRRGTVTRIKRITLPYAEPRGAVMAEIDMPAGSLRVVAAHLGLLKRSRRQQTAALVQALDRADPMPTFLMGDFNEWRPGRPDCPLAELEPFFGPTIQHHPSFPSRRPIFALDRILGWPDGVIEAMTVHDSPLARIASDHLPLKALVDLSTPIPVGTPEGAAEAIR
jgi:endonuclease/exonuclease/phosphatase family metal-dependent hydrolase